MSNQIRPLSPVFGWGQPIVLEVAVEPSVIAFTWAIFKGDDVLVAEDVLRRTNAAGEEVLGLEFTITVLGRHTTSARDSDNSAGELDPADYQVRLFNGARDNGPFEDLELLDQDSFTVLGEGDETGGAPGGAVTDIGQPLRVALVREGAEARIERQSPVTFAAFREYLEANWGPGDDYDAANSWPTFGSRPYRALLKAARKFVATRKVTSFADLMPSGYEEGKLEETERQYPQILLPRNARTAYLPGVELIWNYWLEEGMLVQTLNVILARFQNRRLPGRDPLARFDVTPLLPLRNRLWGYAEEEVHRLTVRRRAVEYEFEYGLPLIGRAVPRPQAMVERRNGFLEAFHQILFLAHGYFKEFDDLTVQADAFPLFRALRDCHIVLSQGTQNQYGEMAVEARAEFLVMQSILAEPQMREFLGGRPMTPYQEDWMDRVDSMKAIQGWTDTSIMHFNDLARIGEQLVLTIRLGNWAADNVGAQEAATWAQGLRNGIQQYVAAYRTVTGVDLSREPNAEVPSTLLARRLSGVRARA